MTRARQRDGFAGLPVALDLPPMEARLADALPSGPGWQFEPKWDGFRCLAFRAGDAVELRAKSGKSLSRYFPEVIAALRAVKASAFVVDGELAVPVGDSLSFDALQMRLHPAASRIHKLAQETPSIFVLFDCLAASSGASLLEAPLAQRRAALEALVGSWGAAPALHLTPYTRERRQAIAWLKRARGALDGCVAKRVDAPYQPGERAMVKVKQVHTADCVVGGFRYASGKKVVGSLLLGLYDDGGRLNHVGFTSSISHDERPALTRRLEKLRAAPGFTGDAPGGPSRWSTERSAVWEPLRPRLVVEVAYDHVTGGRFRHGTRLVRWRPDKAPAQCTCDQMRQEMRPDRLMRALR